MSEITTPNQLLAAVSDELNRRIKNMTIGMDGGLRSASPQMKVLPGFPYTLVRHEAPPDEVDEEPESRPFPPIYDLVEEEDSLFVRFFLSNPTTVNGDYPVKMLVSPFGKQYFFLKVTATTSAAGQCTSAPSWICFDQDVTTDSVEVVSFSSIPDQVNPTVATPCGGTVEATGWGHSYGSPSGTYTFYLPLLCFDFTDGLTISYASGDLGAITTANPQYATIRDWVELAGDSAQLWWSNGGKYGTTIGNRGGDPGALCIANIAAQPLNPEDSPFILRSL